MQDSNLTCPLSETLGYEPSEFVLYSNLRYIFGCGGGNRNHLVQAYETCKCTSSNFPAIYLVQEAGLAPAWFSYLSTNLWRGHVCLSSCLTVWTLPPLLYFLISNMSKNFISSDCLNLCLLYQNIRSCFRFFWYFCGGGGNRTPVLLRQSKDSFTGLV